MHSKKVFLNKYTCISCMAGNIHHNELCSHRLLKCSHIAHQCILFWLTSKRSMPYQSSCLAPVYEQSVVGSLYSLPLEIFGFFCWCMFRTGRKFHFPFINLSSWIFAHFDIASFDSLCAFFAVWLIGLPSTNVISWQLKIITLFRCVTVLRFFCYIAAFELSYYFYHG